MNRYILIRNSIVESGYADQLTVAQVNDLATYLVEQLQENNALFPRVHEIREDGTADVGTVEAGETFTVVGPAGGILT